MMSIMSRNIIEQYEQGFNNMSTLSTSMCIFSTKMSWLSNNMSIMSRNIIEQYEQGFQ